LGYTASSTLATSVALTTATNANIITLSLGIGTYLVSYTN
jgi:hypothetical protein